MSIGIVMCMSCPLFNLTLLEDNIIKMRTGRITEGDTMAIADGSCIFIAPLPHGRHRMHFGLEDNLQEDYSGDGEVT
jgi:hypothetical protein